MVKKFICENIDKTVRFSPNDNGTLIGLPYKYTIPCANDAFQELYYWDTYFTNIGLINLGKIELAKSNIDNMLYLVKKYGFMPNGNRIYYLNRSQPPFLSKMVKDVFEVTKDEQWLANSFEILKKEYSFWQNERLLKNGLNGYTNYKKDYFDESTIDDFANDFILRTGFNVDLTNEELYQAYCSVNESGWDCNSRVLDQGHCYAYIDLNSLLFDYENNMSEFSQILNNGEESMWKTLSRERHKKMASLWCEERGFFMDYNIIAKSFSKYASAASFYPLFVKVATNEQAKKTVINLLPLLEMNCGISAGESEGTRNCQWDYPNVWAPLQYIVHQALVNYDYNKEAERIAYKYCKMVNNCFKKTGNIWEKYDGNTGEVVTSEYDAPPMMGWTAGVYLFFAKKYNFDF